jgi:hypothetical protein
MPRLTLMKLGAPNFGRFDAHGPIGPAADSSLAWQKGTRHETGFTRDQPATGNVDSSHIYHSFGTGGQTPRGTGPSGSVLEADDMVAEHLGRDR